MTDLKPELERALGSAYRLERELVGGGMSRVWVAHDTALDRRIVIKLLPEHAASSMSAERFKREIALAARLQHPHIVPLLSAGEIDGLPFFTMPYVEGESLRDRLTREGELPVDECVQVLKEVARALAYAHEHGIVHRDIKPDNVMLSGGTAVVTDFGVAKALTASAANAAATLTQLGVALGTPAYMSPEQASADANVDHRADLYAFGCMAYEMLTGHPPFVGRSAQSLLAAHVAEVPDPIQRRRPTIPLSLAAIVMQCLAKRPADRPKSAIALLRALDAVVVTARGTDASQSFALSPDMQVGLAPLRRGLHGRRPALIGAALFVVAAVLAAVALPRFASIGTRTEPVTFEIAPPAPNGVPERIAIAQISPDGRAVAFISWSDSISQIYVRPLDGLDARPVPGTRGAVNLAFSPNGRWLAFVTLDGKLSKVMFNGSSLATVASGVVFWGGLVWDTDSTILFGNAEIARNGLARVSASGGTPRPFTTPSKSSSGWEHGRPVVASDGETLLFSVWGPGFLEDDFLAIGSLKTGKFTTTALLAAHAVGVADGRILYVTSAGAMMAVPFDARTRDVTDDPVRVMEGMVVTLPSAELSRNGTLVYRRGHTAQRLVLVDAHGGNRRRMSDEQRNFIVEGEWAQRPVFSPDGRRVAVVIGAQRSDTFALDIWTFDTRTRALTRLTSLGNVAGPAWTPDGRHLVFTTWQNRSPTIWRQTADGSRAPEKLLELPDGHTLFEASPTPDGRGVIYCQFNVGTRALDLLYLPFDGERLPARVLAVPFRVKEPWECAARVSPDGKWLAYVASDGEKSNVYVTRFRQSGARLQVAASAVAPVWSSDGRRLYYRQVEPNGASLSVVEIRPTSGGLELADPRRVATLGEGGMYDVAPDGRDILMYERGDARIQLIVTTNWTSQLRGRLAGTR